jgi:hypothetical protein
MSASSSAGGQCGSGFQRCRAFLRSWGGLVGFENTHSGKMLLPLLRPILPFVDQDLLSYSQSRRFY